MYFTKRQLEVLDFIRQFVARFRMAPTLDEMAQQFRVSRVTVLEHVRALEAKGVLRRTPNRARAIELVEPDADSEASRMLLPILGVVQAGAPCHPFEVPEEFDVQRWIRNPSDYHLLRVTGDSMIEDHIREGDLVLVDRRRIAREGDIVVAATPEGDVTLKRIYRDGEAIRLQPSNAAMAPIYVEAADVRGVVVGLIRQFQ